jgi:hypothetical protein
MKTYIAIYGNGSKRLFDASDVSEANKLANAYGRRNQCGMLCNLYPY